MRGVYKRKGSKNYQMDFTRKNGERVRRSSGTTNRAKAQQLHDKLKSESWDIDHIGKKRDYSWKEAVIRYKKDKQNIKSQEYLTQNIKHLHKFLSDVNLSDINTDMINNIKYSRQSDTYQRQVNGEKYPITSTTANETLKFLKAVLTRAKEKWHWIDNVPPFDFIEVRKDEQASFNWLTHDEAKQVLNELPPHLEAMMRFSLATGLRESNVTRLTWKKVMLDKKIAYVDAIESKNNKPIRIPLNEDAMEVLLKQKNNHEKYVFTYNGTPIKKANTKSWRKSLDRAGIRPFFPSPSDGVSMNKKYPTREIGFYTYLDFRWHDLRHTWASWHVQSGTSLMQLQLLGGWRTYEMVLKYAHLSDSHVDLCANNISIEK